jgi:hypothetical protein
MLTCSQIIAIVMDNASNNNTMMTSLERQHQKQDIYFSAEDAHMQCMPHTIHLAAIKAWIFCVLGWCELYLTLDHLAPRRDQSNVNSRSQEGYRLQRQLSR